MKEYLSCWADKFGERVLLAYGGCSIKKNGIYEEVTSILEKAGKTVIEFSGIMANPTYEKVLEGAKIARENEVDWILGIGGGSVMDCCKAVSLAAISKKDIWKEYWAKPGIIDFEPLPLGVIEYTYTVPVRQMVSGSFDILSHIMETYFSEPDVSNVSDDISEALMRNVIQNLRVAIKNPEDYTARSNLMWDATMAENRVIKLGKKCDFECHQMEHQIGAFTNCNHGEGLAVLHPVYYRHIYKYGLKKFVRFAENVWQIRRGDMTDEALAEAGVNALADFIREIGLPTSLKELGVTEDIDLREIADSCNLSVGSYKKMTHEEILEIFTECI